MIKYIIIGWLLCGLLGAGFNNAYYQRKYSNLCQGREDLGHSLMMSIGGPINLFVVFLITGFGEYGWSLNITTNPRCIKS